MKEKQRLYIEVCTHEGEDTERGVHAGEEYTRRKYYTRRDYTQRGVDAGEEEYIWWSVHMEECTHGRVYT